MLHICSPEVEAGKEKVKRKPTRERNCQQPIKSSLKETEVPVILVISQSELMSDEECVTSRCACGGEVAARNEIRTL